MKKSKKISSVNTNGINICDSIVMSVKKRRVNLRQLESVGIALTGFVSVIMAFLSMFDFKSVLVSSFQLLQSLPKKRKSFSRAIFLL